MTQNKYLTQKLPNNLPKKRNLRKNAICVCLDKYDISLPEGQIS